MNYTATGIIDAILPTESRTSTFQSRALILEIPDDKYPQFIKFEFTQARCDLLDAYKAGDAVTIHFDLRGRVWESQEKGRMYFTSLNGWKIEMVAAGPGQEVPTEPIPESVKEGKDDDLPF